MGTPHPLDKSSEAVQLHEAVGPPYCHGRHFPFKVQFYNATQRITLAYKCP